MNLKTILITLAFFVALIILALLSLFVFKEQLLNNYFSYKYKKEVKVVEKYLLLLEEGNDDLIRKLSTNDSTFLKHLKLYLFSKEVIKKVNINSIKILNVERKHKNKMILDVYFEDDTSLYLIIKLRLESNNWLVHMITFSEEWKYIGDGVK
ncbi:MAG: hypothetical protein KAI43_14550 [Candidatus Aureabacteria bacterium]|nr:hypothetical protein [Candidatus Auribacterota bacterium]